MARTPPEPVIKDNSGLKVKTVLKFQFPHLPDSSLEAKQSRLRAKGLRFPRAQFNGTGKNINRTYEADVVTTRAELYALLSRFRDK